MKTIAVNSVKPQRTNTFVIRYNTKHQPQIDKLLEKAKKAAQTNETHPISGRNILQPILKIVNYGIGALKTPETIERNPSNFNRLSQKAAKKTRKLVDNWLPTPQGEYQVIGIETSRVPLVKKIITAAEKLRKEEPATEVIKAQNTDITLDNFFMTKGLQQVSEYNFPSLGK